MAQLNRFPLVSLMALGFAMPALAQTPAPDQAAAQSAAETARGGDVIIVTANKREESIQDVAIAITAISSEQRDLQGIQTTTDLTNITPGLQYTAGNERVFLRGVGRNTNNFGSEPGIANYTDGIYESFASISGREPIFIDRIEVLRGPQGTLYGRNSIGGLLNTISKRPTNDFEAEFRTGFGNFGERKIQGSISGPIPGLPGIRGRLVGAREVRDKGVFFNYGTNQTEGYNLNDYTIEGQLEGDIGENFSWWVKADTGGYHKAGPPGGTVNVGTQAPYETTFAPSGAVQVNPAFAYSGDPALISYTQDGTFIGNPGATDLRKLNTNVRGEANLDAYNDYALEMIYHAPAFDVKYTGGYVYYDYNLYGDYTGTPVTSITYNAVPGGAAVGYPFAGGTPKTIFPNAYSRYHENRAFFSNEVNFISTYDSPFQWLFGLYQYQENFKQPVETFYPNEPDAQTIVESQPGVGISLIANPNGRLTYTNNIGLNNSYGVYGQGDWQFTDTLKATLGLRYSYDQKHITEEAALNCWIVCAQGTTNFVDVTTAFWNGKAFDANGNEIGQAGVTSATPTNLSGVTHNYATGVSSRVLGDTYNAVTGTAGLEWTPTRDTLVFGKYSRGYKAGGFNATSMSPRPGTAPEHIDSYEIGWKQEWRQIGLTTNIDTFYYNYTDVQTPLTVVPLTGPSYGAFVNVPKIEDYGIELESTWEPVDNLNIRFTYGYLSAKVKESGVYQNPLTPAAVLPTDPAYVNPAQSVKGNTLPQSPRNKVAINANYTWDFADGSNLIPSVSWYWRDKFTTSIFNDPNSYTPDFDQTDARLTWNSGGGHYTWILYGRNIFDQEGYDGISASLRRNAGFVPGSFVSPTNSAGTIYTSTTLTPPRMYGIEFQFHFK